MSALRLAIIPYLLGVLISRRFIPANILLRDEENADLLPSKPEPERQIDDRFLVGIKDRGDPFEGVTLVLHRSGEADPCGWSREGILRAIQRSLLDVANGSARASTDLFNKYQVDAALTSAFGTSIISKDECGPYEGASDFGHSVSKWYVDMVTESDDTGTVPPPAFFGLCDMGEEATPINPDHDKIVKIHVQGSGSRLPCHFHTREGVRITSISQFADLALATKPEESCADSDTEDTCSGWNKEGVRALHLYAVPAGRHFIFAPSFVGEIFHLPHVEVKSGLPVSLEVLSLSPRVFDVKNFFDKEESKAIVDKALAETSESYRMKRSSTGAVGYHVNSVRTSENGFDTHGKEAQAVKKRCFAALGFDEFVDSMADGLQVLRYNATTAYISHMDWIDDNEQEHDFDSAGVGSNRFATILLYMSDLDEGDGGETVFSEAWPIGQPEEEHVSIDEALRKLRNSGGVGMLAKGSWEEKMVAECRTRLAIRPNAARAVLFYSQHPFGAPDMSSLHGGCPVLTEEKVKFAANLWVWNGPRNGFPGEPRNMDVVRRNEDEGNRVDYGAVSAAFVNTGNDDRFKEAALYFQDSFWGELGWGEKVYVNTYVGHIWNVQVGGEILKEWTVGDEKEQTFKL